MGIQKYGIKLFGQPVEMVGNGGTSGVSKNYFFIDCSYLYTALRYGLLVLVIFCIYFVAINYKMMKRKNIFFTIVVAFIAINSMVAHHFIDIAYNPFLLSFFAFIEDQ